MSRPLRVALQVAVSGAIVGFLLWRIDLVSTWETLRESDYVLVAGALAIFIATTWLMAWRWLVLLRARGAEEPFGWLLRLYFVSYAAANVLPTAIGGDAVRVIEHARRRPGVTATAVGAVVMERILGLVATLVLVAVGLAVAAGRYEGVRLLLVVELALVALMVLVGLLLFSRRLGRHLEERLFPLGRRIRLERPLRSLHGALHEYRYAPGALFAVLGASLAAQAARVVAIWLCGQAVGIDVSPLVFVILGPLLFLVQMAPFTLNGLGVREAFFVVFLAQFDVAADAALAVGILYYGVTIATALPGGFWLLWRSFGPAAPARP